MPIVASIRVSPGFLEDEVIGAAPVAVDSGDRQVVGLLPSRREAEAGAAAINAQHGGAPFRAYLENEAGGGDHSLVTAGVAPTTDRRWAVCLVGQARAC
jgi:hypothetical protein